MNGSTPGYVDTLGFLGDVGFPMFDAETLANARKSGVILFHLTTAAPFRGWEENIQYHERIMQALEQNSDTFLVVRSAADVVLPAQTGKIGVIPGIQDPEFIGDRLDRLEILFNRGVRIMQVAYQKKNPYGAGFLAEDQDSGLTGLGRDFVKEVSRAGMILDLSHLSPLTALDCLQVCEGPVMISHTTARDIYPHPRGSLDKVLEALSHQEDTLAGILAMTFFLDKTNTSLELLVRHIRHVTDIIGTQKVAVGSDGPVGGFTDLNAAEKGFREIMGPIIDPEGKLGSRWPTHIPEFSHGPDGFENLRKAIEPFFTPREVEGILGGNGLRWFSRALPGGDFSRGGAK